MREWNLGPGDPLCLTLSADARLGGADYLNDHTWELEIGNGQPPALALRTSFGLRARSMRIFPRFGEGRQIATHPSEFPSPPRLRSFAPNFLALDFSPLDELDVRAEYWVPQSQVIAGRFTFTNRSPSARKIQFYLSAVLIPVNGQSCADTQIQLVHVLAGRTGGLSPLLYMTGVPAPAAGPYPSLVVDLDFLPGTSRSIKWTMTTLANNQDSFNLARRIVLQSWEAEQARIEMLANSDVFDIHTGDPQWDAAFALSQTNALRLFFPASQHLPNPSFVQSRGPDHGFSHKGDGSDYPPAWAGQSPLESYYLASILPGVPRLARGILKNFITAQTPNVAVDLRPGLAGQRGKIQATPMLVSLAWALYQSTQNKNILAETFQELQAFFWSWFSPAHDRDRDGLPEWDHLQQTGWEENPLFDIWQSWSQGVDLDAVQQLALHAMLAREAKCLILISDVLQYAKGMEFVKLQAKILKDAIDSAWNDNLALYQYRDRKTRITSIGVIIASGRGEEKFKLDYVSEQPFRLLIDIQAKHRAGKKPQVYIAENAMDEATEEITRDQFRWRPGGWVATSQQTYNRISRIDIIGTSKKDRVFVRVVDLTMQDHTLFLPFWAHLPDQQLSKKIVDQVLGDTKRFNRPYGIPACASSPMGEAESTLLAVHLPWNHLIGEGLLEYGFREEAARLTTNLMKAVIQSLKQNCSFSGRYHAVTGAGLGERNALTGLAPLGLFLQTLGVTVHSSTRVRLEGKNPFPWPVTIRYRSLTIQRGLDSTEITFHNGKSVTVTSLAPCVVEM